MRVESARPLLRWAGGKTQLLTQLRMCLPGKFNRYIEPMIGGGALFFALAPRNGIIADVNPELVNLYRAVRGQVDAVIDALSRHENTKEHYLEVRAIDWRNELTSAEAAARTIFLNRTCFNGVYRINRRGGFNVPYGNLKNPKICDEANLRAASAILSHAKIGLGDFREVLAEVEPGEGDVVFLDPPYVPVVESDRTDKGSGSLYTATGFSIEDQRALALLVREMSQRGAHVILTNSNHPVVHELYEDFEVQVHETRRYINRDASNRKGQDVIVVARPDALSGALTTVA